ncbi:MAG: hypothetical protein JNJ90_04325 [Saprospiraceae bacterium]|nr:hypothetical protein [Saprospiraceae bacterium]
MPHGNSHENKQSHHLYKIWDVEEQKVFKYGISDDPIDADGMSDRLRDQINLYNLVANFIRFIGEVLLRNIPGRAEAERIEKDYIERHIEEFGERPRGNRKKGR